MRSSNLCKPTLGQVVRQLSEVELSILEYACLLIVVGSFFHLNDHDNTAFVAFVVVAMYFNPPSVVSVWLSGRDFGVCLAMIAPSGCLRREITHQSNPLLSNQAA
jgi:hypothetical protein